MPIIGRPTADEHSPYFGTYISQAPGDDALPLLTRQIDETVALLNGVPEDRWTYRYAPGKWSLAEVVGHLSDTERIFAYRALCFARKDPTPLPGFQENDYAPASGHHARSLPDLTAELQAVRQASLALFRGLTDEAVGRRGVANGVEISVRAIAWILAGHERHHLGVVRERYLGG